MTPEELNEIEARAKAALTYEKSEWDPEEQMYVGPASGTAPTEIFTCPLCDGDGDIDGQRYDTKEEIAATVVAYGIGKGLQLAEEWVERAPTDILLLVAEVRRLRGGAS